MMVISLFSSRIVLQTLGSTDYGLYNVVGGFIAFFFFFSNSLSVACERFMAYAMGLGDSVLKRNVYSITVVLFIILSIALIVVGAVAGIPFVKHGLNIPTGREQVALYVFLWSLMNGALSFFRVPFNAAIIAYERMSFYSWISILESVMKLLLLYGLYIFDYDKLLLFAILQAALTFVITAAYAVYCRINFHDFTVNHIWDKGLFKQLFSYVGWNVFGGLADLAISHGLTIVFNLFFGTIINAAQSIATQIRSQIASFVNNINVASGPAITKYYAAKDNENCIKLYFTISKLDYLLLLIICVPVIFTLESVLDIWLGHGVYPKETVELTVLVLINTLVDTLSGCSQSIVYSSGKIKAYQLIVSILKLFSMVVVYLVLSIYSTPFVAYAVLIILALPRVVYQIYIASKFLDLGYKKYVVSVLIPNLIITLLAFSVSYGISLMNVSQYQLVNVGIKGSLCLLLSIAFSYFIGFTKVERTKIQSIIKNKIKR